MSKDLETIAKRWIAEYYAKTGADKDLAEWLAGGHCEMLVAFHLHVLSQQPPAGQVELTDANIDTIASFIAGQMDNTGHHNRFDAAKKALTLYRDHLASAPRTNEDAGGWIPVSERLPEPNNEVLVFFRDCSIVSTGQWTTRNQRYKEMGWLTPCENWNNGPVTHWMPLPSPPTE